MNIYKKSSSILCALLLISAMPSNYAMQKDDQNQSDKKNRIAAFFKSNTFKNALLIGSGCLGGFMIARSLLKVEDDKITDLSFGGNAFKACAEFIKNSGQIYVATTSMLTGALVQWGAMRLFEQKFGHIFSTPKDSTEFSDSSDIYLNALDSAPEEIKELCELIDGKQEVVENINDILPLGYILHGPPGCGKTEIAKAMANKLIAGFYVINYSDIASSIYNMTAQNLKKRFDTIRSQTPEKSMAVVFIDEIDVLAPHRVTSPSEGNVTAQEDNKTVNMLLQQIQGFNKQNKKLIIIGATNRKDVIDEALLSRLVPIEMQLPTMQQRKAALKHQTAKVFGKPFTDEILKMLAKETENFSYRDLLTFIRAFARKTAICKPGSADIMDILMNCLKHAKELRDKRAQSIEGSKAPESMYS